MQIRHQRNISAKIQKNIQKCDYRDGFGLQGELNLPLFYMIEGYFEKPKSLMTGKTPLNIHLFF